MPDGRTRYRNWANANNRLGESDTSVPRLYCVDDHDNVDRGSSVKMNADLMIRRIDACAYQAFRNRGPVVAPRFGADTPHGQPGDWVDGCSGTSYGDCSLTEYVRGWCLWTRTPFERSSFSQPRTRFFCHRRDCCSEATLGRQDRSLGLMLPSGNEASVAWRNTLGGRVLGEESREGSRFHCRDEYDRKRIGMLQTLTPNTQRLDVQGHLTTAADFAIRAKAANCSCPIFREIVGTSPLF